MSNLDDTEYGITGLKLDSGETLVTEVFGTESFVERLSDVFIDFIACTASVNQRYVGWLGR